MSVSQQIAIGVSRPYNSIDSFKRGPIGPVGPIGHIWTDAILAQAGFDFEIDQLVVVACSESALLRKYFPEELTLVVPIGKFFGFPA